MGAFGLLFYSDATLLKEVYISTGEVSCITWQNAITKYMVEYRIKHYNALKSNFQGIVPN